MRLQAWWKLARFEHSIMVAVAILAGQAVASKILHLPFSFSFSTLFPVLGPMLVTAAAFILNDYADYKADMLEHKTDRPLVSGAIKRSTSLKASIIVYALGLMLSAMVNPLAFDVAAGFAILSIAYNFILKKLPLIGNVYIASAMAISFIYGNFVVSPYIVNYVALFAGFSFLAGIGREFIITLRDVAGDKRTGSLTVPMILGARSTILLSSLLFGVSIELSWIPFVLKFSWPYFMLILANNLLLLHTLSMLITDHSQKNLKRARNLTLAAMALGLLAVVSFAF